MESGAYGVAILFLIIAFIAFLLGGEFLTVLCSIIGILCILGGLDESNN